MPAFYYSTGDAAGGTLAPVGIVLNSFCSTFRFGPPAGWRDPICVAGGAPGARTGGGTADGLASNCGVEPVVSAS